LDVVEIRGACQPTLISLRTTTKPPQDLRPIGKKCEIGRLGPSS
jgi:hypothetical protein